MRAERRLRDNRKTVWWSTWFFELQIKLVELRLFMALGRDEIEYPLPVLGPQGAAIGTATLADRLIDNSMRMIRFDVFRLSRVVESYGNCLLALKVWRQRCLPDGPDLPESVRSDRMLKNEAVRDAMTLMQRQDEMKRLLGEYRAELKTRIAIRKSLDGGSTEAVTERHPDTATAGATPLDAEVATYADWVIEYTQKLIDVPPRPAGEW